MACVVVPASAQVPGCVMALGPGHACVCSSETAGHGEAMSFSFVKVQLKVQAFSGHFSAVC